MYVNSKGKLKIAVQKSVFLILFVLKIYSHYGTEFTSKRKMLFFILPKQKQNNDGNNPSLPPGLENENCISCMSKQLNLIRVVFIFQKQLTCSPYRPEVPLLVNVRENTNNPWEFSFSKLSKQNPCYRQPESFFFFSSIQGPSRISLLIFPFPHKDKDRGWEC